MAPTGGKSANGITNGATTPSNVNDRPVGVTTIPVIGSMPAIPGGRAIPRSVNRPPTVNPVIGRPPVRAPLGANRAANNARPAGEKGTG